MDAISATTTQFFLQIVAKERAFKRYAVYRAEDFYSSTCQAPYLKAFA